MSISFGGLASGLDTNTIIDKLMALERAPQNRLTLRQQQVQARQDVLREIGTKLRALDAAATALRSVSTWGDTQTVSSTDPTRVDVRRVSGAAPGGYQVGVTQLARAEQRTFAYTPPAAAEQLTIGGLTVDIAAGASLTDVVSDINRATGSPVYASAVNGQLVLSGRATGATKGFTATAGSLVEDTSRAKVALDAIYTIDGETFTSSSNVVTDGLLGVELTLKTPTIGTVAVTVGAPGPDTEKVKAAMQSLVDTYNTATEYIRGKINERPVAKPGSVAEAQKGAVYADSMLNGLLAQLRGSFTKAVAGNPADLNELSEIGISTGATTGSGTLSSTAIAGRLVLDTAKLTTALAKDPVAVRRLLSGEGATKGFTTTFNELIQPLTTSGGQLDSRLESATAELKRVAASMADMDTRLELREKALRARFTAMEVALQSSQSQGAWLNGQIAALKK